MKELTRRGYAMNAAVRARVVAVLQEPQHVGLRQPELAKLCGVSERTLRDYLTDELREEVALRRAGGFVEPVGQRNPLDEAALACVDRAMWQRAVLGNVAAAKLLYVRALQQQQTQGGLEPLPTLAELEAALQTMKEAEHGVLDDAADVGAGEG